MFPWERLSAQNVAFFVSWNVLCRNSWIHFTHAYWANSLCTCCAGAEDSILWVSQEASICWYQTPQLLYRAFWVWCNLRQCTWPRIHFSLWGPSYLRALPSGFGTKHHRVQYTGDGFEFWRKRTRVFSKGNFLFKMAQCWRWILKCLGCLSSFPPIFYYKNWFSIYT